MTILIADDSARMRATIRSVLSLGADEVLECDNGGDAVLLYQYHRPAWVLMDVAMPGLDGIRATARIRALDPNARIVIVSDFADSALQEAAHAAGAVAYVPKEDLSPLLDVVRPRGTTL